MALNDTVKKIVANSKAQELEKFANTINKQLSFTPTVLRAYQPRGVNENIDKNRNLMIIGVIPPQKLVDFMAIKYTPGNQITDKQIQPVNTTDPKFGFKYKAEANVDELSKDKAALDAILNSKLPPEELAAVLLASSGADSKSSMLNLPLDAGEAPVGGIVGLSASQVAATLGESAGKRWASALDSGNAADQISIASEYLYNQVDGNEWPLSAQNMYSASAGVPPDKIGDSKYKVRPSGELEIPNTLNAPGKVDFGPNDELVGQSTSTGWTLFGNGRKQDSTYTQRSDQARPAKPGDPGYDQTVVLEQRAYDFVNSLDKSRRGSVTVGDLGARTEEMKGTKAYQDLVEAINRRRLELTTGVSATTGLTEAATNGFRTASIFGTDVTFNATNPAASLGSSNAIDATRQMKSIQRLIQSVNNQIIAYSNLSPIYFIVNPASFSRSYAATVDVAKGRRGSIVSMWNEQPLSISASGSTPAQFFVDGSSKPQGGLTNINRIYSVSYQNLMQMVSIYKTNGIMYTDPTEMNGNGGIPIYPLSCYIYYDGRIYVGSFDSFTVSDTADKPHNLSYDFNFTCRYEVQAYEQGVEQ
jgi:hypothetical protein